MEGSDKFESLRTCRRRMNVKGAAKREGAESGKVRSKSSPILVQKVADWYLSLIIPEQR